MLILGVEDPRGEEHMAAAFPSACGKTNLAMLIPPDAMKGLESVDGRRRHRLDQAGRERSLARDQSRGRRVWRRAGDVEGDQSQRHGDRRPQHDLHERGPDARGGVWWEGMTEHPPAECLDWRGERWTPEIGRLAGRTAAHPNARFTAPASQCPIIDADWEAPEGVPISAIIFGSRRANTLPLVYQSFNWSSGVYVGATMGSETTAAATGSVGALRRDPMAMLPFCGYHMGDYFRHWIKMQRLLSETPIFHVNWFRKDAEAAFSGRGFARTCVC